MPVHSVAIGKHWAFELGMRYPPVCPHSLMRNIKRHERVTPIGPVRALTLPWLHGRLPQQGKCEGKPWRIPREEDRASTS